MMILLKIMFKLFFSFFFFICLETQAYSTELGEVNNFGELVSKFWLIGSQIIFGISTAAIIAGGALLMFSGGNDNKVLVAKSTISGAIISIILVTFSALLQSVLQDQASEIDHMPQLQDSVKIIDNVISSFLALIGGISTLVIIFLTLKLIISGGELEKIEQAKKGLKLAILGTLTALAAFMIFNFIIAPF